MEYERRVRTSADPTRAWMAVADVTAYPRWTASMTDVSPLDGEVLAVGRRYRISQPGLPANLWQVTEVYEGESFTWTSSVPGVTTEAYHRVVGLPDGGSEITAGLRQTGRLAGIFGRLAGGKIRRSVDMEAAGLARAAEADRT